MAWQNVLTMGGGVSASGAGFISDDGVKFYGTATYGGSPAAITVSGLDGLGISDLPVRITTTLKSTLGDLYPDTIEVDWATGVATTLHTGGVDPVDSVKQDTGSVASPGSSETVNVTFDGDGAGTGDFETIIEVDAPLAHTEGELDIELATVAVGLFAGTTLTIELPPIDASLAVYPAGSAFVSLDSGGGVVSAIGGGFAYTAEVADVLEASEAVRGDVTVTVADQLEATDVVLSSADLSAAIADVLEISDAARVHLDSAIADVLEASEDITSNYRAIAEAIDRLALTDVASSHLAATELIALSLAIADACGPITISELVDQLEINDDLSASYGATVALLDTLLASESIQGTVHATVACADTLQITEDLSSVLAATETIEDRLEIMLRVAVDGHVFVAWVLNPASKRFSTYTNYPFTGFCRMGGRYYGVAPDGVYLLEGDDDAGDPITAPLRTGLTNLGTAQGKRVPYMYLGYRSDGPLVLKVITTSPTGEKEEDWYELAPQTADAFREARIEIGRGLQSVMWGFELVAKDGADFEIDTIQWYPVALDWRV